MKGMNNQEEIVEEKNYWYLKLIGSFKSLEP